jgi:membrane-bound serine protease (ClpP class)
MTSKAARRMLAASAIAAIANVSGVGLAQRPLLAQETGAKRQPLVYASEIDGIIHPVSAEFMIHTIDLADEAKADLVLFTLRTPGGLVDSTRSINSRIISARTPVAIFIGPSGARAASAGFLISMAADLVVMAPGTHLGAAHPVSGSGQQMDEVMAKKAASDVAAYARSLASRRGRNVQLVEQAVTESRAFTEEEALKASPPLIDIIAKDSTEVLKALDGRTVKRFDGETAVLHTANARVESIEMTWRQRVLSAVAHPQVAYLLFTLGTLGLTIELWSPGAVLPGVVGGLCLLLAFFAFQILPVNYAALLLILFGLVLLVLEVKVASFGLLGIGGVVSIAFGSMMMFDSPQPELRINLGIIIPITLAMSFIVFFLARLALAAQLRRPVTGNAGMVGISGRALVRIAPGTPGRILTRGEIWNAVSTEPIEAGESVRVIDVEGLTLAVRPERSVPEERPQ